MEALECRLTPAVTAAGAAFGSLPTVQILGEDGSAIRSFLAYDASYRGGVNVAMGDINGDGVADVITGTDRGRAIVNVFDGVTDQLLKTFTPFGPAFRGGVNVAYGHFGADGLGDVVAGMAHNGSQVRVFGGPDLAQIRQWTAYGRGVDGVRVAVGNLDGGFESDVITAPGPGGAPVLKWFDVASGEQAGRALAFEAGYRGGVQIASGDFDNNRVPDIAVAREHAHHPVIRVYAAGVGGPRVDQFVAAGLPRTGTVELGAVGTGGREPDRIAVSRHDPTPGVPGSVHRVVHFDAGGAAVGGTSLAATQVRQAVPLASAPEAVFLGYNGPRADGIAYNPTWPGWFPTAGTQLEDSDFVNDAFVGLWGGANGQGRQDMQIMQQTGFNVIRLYNWGPTRGWNGATQSGSGHLGFLDQAQAQGMKVIVPVSDYFLNDNQYSWNGQAPDATYSFGSAPQAIQDDLNYFIRSITTSGGQLHPAVHSISVGNELDLGIDQDPGITAKTQRAIWWVVNLQNALQAQFGAAVPNQFLSIPVSNADQGNDSASQRSWFQVFLHGANAGDLAPQGAVGGSSFNASFQGLGAYPWYSTWFYNSVNIQQSGDLLANTLKQYDTGVPSGPGWSNSWPGEKFEVPLLLSELGISRFNIGDESQFNIVAEQQTLVAITAIKQAQNLMGLAIFEFNDEPNKNGYSEAAPISEALFGIQKYYNTTNQNDFRNGQVAATINTGPTAVSFGTFPNYALPVYQLFPVISGQKTLLQRIKEILAG